MSSSTIPNACPGLRVSGSPGPSSSATSTKSTSPTCERGWQGSSRQDKRGSHYLRTKRFVKLSMRTHITNSVKRILMGSSFSRHRNVKFHPSVYVKRQLNSTCELPHQKYYF